MGDLVEFPVQSLAERCVVITPNEDTPLLRKRATDVFLLEGNSTDHLRVDFEHKTIVMADTRGRCLSVDFGRDPVHIELRGKSEDVFELAVEAIEDCARDLRQSLERWKRRKPIDP